MEERKNERNLSLDLFRIICMFLITTIHIVNYSGLIEYVPPTHFNFYLICLINVLQSFSISGFTLISAYFLIEKKNTIKRLVSFEIQTVFFSVFFFILSLFISTNIRLRDLLTSFFPFLSQHYWYVSNYIILLICVPVLNKLIHALNQKELAGAIVVFSIIISLFYVINPFYDSEVFIGHHTHSLIWFFMLYFIAAYFKLYGFTRIKPFVILFVISGGLLFILNIINNNGFFLAEKYPIIQTLFSRSHILSYDSVVSLVFTVSCFAIFTKLKIKANNKLSRAFAFCIPAVFAIYLFQEHNRIRTYLWEFVDITKWATSYTLPLIIVAVFLVLFVIAFLSYLLYRLLHKFILHKIEDRICNWIDLLTRRITEAAKHD